MKKKPTRSQLRLRPKKRPGKIHPRRIVILDDEPTMVDLHELALRHLFSDPSQLEIVTFTDPVKAMDELLRKNPDLLITDWNHPGMGCAEMFEALAVRKIKYPIFVISAFASATLNKHLTKLNQTLGLTIKLLPKPYEIDGLRRLLSRHFHLSAITTMERALNC